MKNFLYILECTINGHSFTTKLVKTKNYYGRYYKKKMQKMSLNTPFYGSPAFILFLFSLYFYYWLFFFSWQLLISIFNLYFLPLFFTFIVIISGVPIASTEVEKGLRDVRMLLVDIIGLN